MKRSELEAKFWGTVETTKGMIKSKPLEACAGGIVIGFVLRSFLGIIVPLLIVAACVAAVAWMIAEKDDAAPGATPYNGPSVNGRETRP